MAPEYVTALTVFMPVQGSQPVLVVSIKVEFKSVTKMLWPASTSQKLTA
jgi:hypothetical protein